MPEDVNPSQKRSGLPFSIDTKNIRGGVTIAVLGLLLLLGTFYIPSPTVPRLMAIGLTIIGVAAAGGLVPVRAPRDFYGGAVLIALAILALTASADLPGQRGFAFGPGTAPRLFSGILALLGAAVVAVGALTEGPRIEEYKIRGPLLVIIAILLFAALIRPFGLIVATYLAFIVSILGSTEMRWIESLIGAAVMTVFCVLLFVNLLNLPFQLWPQPNAHVILFTQFEDILKTVLLIFQKAVGLK